MYANETIFKYRNQAIYIWKYKRVYGMDIMYINTFKCGYNVIQRKFTISD